MQAQAALQAQSYSLYANEAHYLNDSAKVARYGATVINRSVA